MGVEFVQTIVMIKRLAPALVLTCLALTAHPMGNFSVSHYTRIETGARGAQIRYALDLAEIPTFELLQQWKLEASSPKDQLEAKAAEQAREWAKSLAITVNGRSVAPRVTGTKLHIEPGAGGMAVMRITSDLHIAAAPGPLTYEDRNYAERTGWKEIVIAGRNADRSQELTAYPQDPTVAPPQDVKASIEWSPSAPAPVPVTPQIPVVVSPDVPVSPVVSSPGPMTQQPPAAGTVVKGDYLSRLLHGGELSFGAILLGMAVAFGLGSMHALSPGHGKTIVAAYLVGTRGTAKHAAFLGGMVTFTHTISVFFLGFVTLFLSQYVLPEKIYPILGAISGASIVWIGATLLFKRWRALHGHTHDHINHHHNHQHDHDHDHAHDHHQHGLAHDHGDGHVHSHVPEGDVTLASLVALGASGGLVPCPSALVLLLSSIALGRVALGLSLLVAFSAGLAVVLTGIGLAVVYARHLLPDSRKAVQSPAFRLIPVLSAAVIVCLGLIMTGVSLGVIRPDRILPGA